MFASTRIPAQSSIRKPPTPERGPGQALWSRRAGKQPRDPGAFCAALLEPMRYRLPENADRPTWEIALLHFAERQPSEAEFRRLLEQRMRRKHDQGGSLNSVDAGATVAAYLLHEWERYQVAARLPAGRQAKPTGGPAE